MTPSCQYCGKAAALVTGAAIYPHRQDLHQLKFWSCKDCDAYVGCHKKGAVVDGKVSDGTMPLGVLANAELRRAKSAAHLAFDPLWKSGRMNRRKAYSKLAELLGVSVENCHIGLFSVEQCKKVCEVTRNMK